MKIHKQIIANGLEWKPCVYCSKRFVFGEIITAITNDSGDDCRYWYCAECFEKFWFAPMPVPVERNENYQLVIIKDNKLTLCPRPISPAEYMLRNNCDSQLKQGSFYVFNQRMA